MGIREDYTRHMSAALALTLAILGSFQLYFVREPARIEADEAADQHRAVVAGQTLYLEHCTDCHGENGGGGSGPALNAKDLLGLAGDDTLASLTRSGIPGTAMPAWGQVFGGPLTDQQVTQLVTFIRMWEPDAPEATTVVSAPDKLRGAQIYARTCQICHGPEGRGTERSPGLRDPERMGKLDDAWYRNTIAHGRPAKGMPTWGTVLSPSQINDLVALVAAWRAGETVIARIPLATHVAGALFAVREFDSADAEYFLDLALAQSDRTQAAEIRAVLELVRANRMFEAQARLVKLLPPDEMGRASFALNCAACHGPDGSGGTGPGLLANAFVRARSDEELAAFLLAGKPGTAMEGLEGIVTEDELATLLALLRQWQD